MKLHNFIESTKRKKRERRPHGINEKPAVFIRRCTKRLRASFTKPKELNFWDQSN